MSERSDREIHSALVERMRSSNISPGTARRLADESLRRTEKRIEQGNQRSPKG